MQSTLKRWAACSAVAILTAQAGCAMAQESVWQNSYTLEAAGKYAEALSALDAVPANGLDAELKLLRRGWLFYYAGKFDESLREYRLAIERNPKSMDARLGICLPLLAAKRWREAEQAARTALDLVPNNYTGLVRLAAAQEGMQDWPAMLKTSNMLVSLYPSDTVGHVYLARTNAWLGRRTEAVAAYTAVLTRYPSSSEARTYIDKK
jgi:tetratricopeptide (TPR) repeat protein